MSLHTGVAITVAVPECSELNRASVEEALRKEFLGCSVWIEQSPDLDVPDDVSIEFTQRHPYKRFGGALCEQANLIVSGLFRENF